MASDKRLLTKKSKEYLWADVPCAFEVYPQQAPTVEFVRIKWTALMAARLSDMAKAAEKTGVPEGKSLPYASLRMMVQAKCHQAAFIADDLGAPWRIKDGKTDKFILEGSADTDFTKLLESCIQLWSETYLYDWSERLQLPDHYIDEIQEVVRTGDAVEEGGTVKLESGESYKISGDNFERVASAILQTASKRLTGKKIFDGLGQLHRIVRSQRRSRELEFETWPASAPGKDGLYSMTLTLTVASQPFSESPIVTVRASRRRWITAIPDYVRASSIEAHMMTRGEGTPHVSVMFPLPVHKGKIQNPVDPHHAAKALEWGADIGMTIDSMAHLAAPGGTVFTGIPYSNVYRPLHQIGSGASDQDLYDAFQKIKQLMRPDGWDAIPGTRITSPKKRKVEQFKLVELEDQLIDFAIANGKNDVSVEGLADALDDFLLLTDSSKTSIKNPPKDLNKLQNVRDVNKQKVVRAYGDEKPKVVVIAKTENERKRLRQIIERLFGNALVLHEIPLPPGVHGPADILLENGRKLRAQGRFDKRVAAWEPALEVLKKIGSGCHVIVQADEYYGNKKDDPVSKTAGRHALAAKGGANVQYLLPMEESRRTGIPNYLIRSQMAVYDVLFGHTGLVSDVSDAIEEAFPDATTRPGAIFGVSVVSQSRSRIIGGGAGRICLGTKIDVKTGRTSAKIGYWDSVNKMACWDIPWNPLHDVLKQVAGLTELRKIGDTKEIEQKTYQEFTESVLDDAQSVPGGAVVMFDSTLAAATLWPWLSDRDINGSKIVIVDPTRDSSSRWPNVRLVRIRPRITPPIISFKHALYAEVDPLTGDEISEPESIGYATMVPRILRTTQDGEISRNYWITAGYPKTVQVTRGRSVYRRVNRISHADGGYDPADAAIDIADLYTLAEKTPIYDSYRSPNSIEVTVARSCQGDQQDLIAGLVQQLRYGFAHTSDDTMLPAPLFFENKVRDYMIRFDVAGVSEEESGDDDTPPDNGGGDEIPEENHSSSDQGEGVAELDERVEQRRIDLDKVMPLRTLTAIRMDIPDPIGGSDLPGMENVATASPLELRQPLMPLPEFVTPEWLSQCMAASAKLRRTIFENREYITEATGFDDWTTGTPTEIEFSRIMLKGMRYPLFLWTVNAVGATQWPVGHGKRAKFAILNKLRLKYYATVKQIRMANRESLINSNGDAISLLIKNKDGIERLIIDAAFAFEATHGAETDLVEVIDSHSEFFAETRAFHNAAKLHLSRQPKSLILEILKDVGSGKKAVKQAEEASAMKEPPISDDAEPAQRGSADGEEDVGHDDANHEITSADSIGNDVGGDEQLNVTDTAPGSSQIVSRDESRADLEQQWRELMQVIAAEATAAATMMPDATMIGKLGDYIKDTGEICETWIRLAPQESDATPYLIFALESIGEVEALCSRYPRMTLVLQEDRDHLAKALAAAASIKLISPDAEKALNDLRSEIEDVHVNVRKHASAWDQARKDYVDQPELMDIVMAEQQALLSTLDVLVPKLREFTGAISESAVAGQTVAADFKDSVDDIHATRKEVQTSSAPQAPEEAQPQDQEIDSAGETFDDLIDDLDGTDISYEEMAALAAEISADSPGEPAEPEVITEPEPEENPFAEAVSERILRHLRQGDYGLSYHLTRASSRVFTAESLPISQDEIRLIAIAGHVNHSAGHASILVQSLIGAVDEVIYGLDEDSDFVTARKLFAFGASIEHALLSRQSGAAQLVEKITLDAAFNDDVYPLKETLLAACHMDMPLTLPLFASLKPHLQAKDVGTEKRKAAAKKAKALIRINFDFGLAKKVLNHLARKEGAIGRLITLLEEGDGLEQAKQFCEEWGDRSSIIVQLDKAEAEVNGRVQGIDGGARERFVANVLELAGLCREYAESQELLPFMSKVSGRSNLAAFSERLRTSSERALRAVKRLADDETTGPSSRAAAAFSVKQFSRLISIAIGEARQPLPLEHMIATHGSLLWLDGLRYGSSWLPSPYEPQQIIETILSGRREVPKIDDIVSSKIFDDAIRHHVNAGSFIPARMLVSVSSAYGIADADRERAAAYIDGESGAAKEDAKEGLRKIRQALENVARTAETISEQEQAATQITKVEIVNLDSIPPQEANLEALTEEETPDLILDIASVRVLTADVTYQTRQISQRKRDALWKSFNLIKDSQIVQESDLQRISGLIDNDDLITAEEFLTHLEKGTPLPPSLKAHWRFAEFFPAVPTAAYAAGRDFYASVLSAIRNANDLGNLKFSSIPEDRRETAATIWSGWNDVRRSVSNNMNPEHVFGGLCHFLGNIGIQADVHQVQSHSSIDNKPFGATLRMRLPYDPKGMLLPEFGSLSNGYFKVMLSVGYPDDHEITRFMEGPTGEAKIVFIVGVVHPNRWGQLAQKCRTGSWRLLVIDDASMAYAVSEPEFRPLTPFELAEPFSYSTPYKDYGASRVPPEVFVGRTREIQEVLSPYGSCVLYGGRRLGKTALLLHTASMNHNPKTSYLCYHINIEEVGGISSPASHLWQKITQGMPELFGAKQVTSGEEFSGLVDLWLEINDTGRIVLMLDEADKFVAKDAQSGFASFKILQKLMEDSGRRFKIVLAGIHNVTRFVRSGNPPIKQIASNPLRIGPLMEGELADAEKLVTKPLSALGFEFETRDLVWRILSRTNYYPILIHVFCEKLLERLRLIPVSLKKEPPFIITSKMVNDALDDTGIDEAIKEKINVTLDVDPRYKVLAYVVANCMLSEASEGRMAEGITSVTIREDAAYFWPAAFSGIDSLFVIEDLLDEMEGLGILLRTGVGRWVLRSPSIRKLLGDKDRISAVLLQYSEENPPPAMDLRTARRYVPADEDGGIVYPAPLTMGQEHDLVSDTAKATIIFGNLLSEIDLVAHSLKSVLTAEGEANRFVIRVHKRLDSLMQELSTTSVTRNWKRQFLVLTPDSPWNADWIQDVLTVKQARNGDIHVVFIGGPEHAYKWLNDPRSKEVGPQVSVMSLQPWSDVMVSQAMLRLNISLDHDLRSKIMSVTGGYNRLMAKVLEEMKASTNRAKKLELWTRKNIVETNLDLDLGVIDSIDEAATHLAVWKDTPMSADDIRALVTDHTDTGMSTDDFIRFAEAMHILRPASEKGPEDRFIRKWVVNPVLTENRGPAGEAQ